MVATTMTSKGRITIPSDVRKAMRIASGDRIEFVEVGPGRFEIVATSGSVLDLKGMFGPVRRVALEEMDKVIVSGACSDE